MKYKSLNLIRVWNSQTLKIKHHFFLRSEIIVGSDPDANLQIPILQGLCARLDLTARELIHLDDGRAQTLEPGQIVEMGPISFQWKLIPIVSRKLLWVISVVGVGLGVMGVGSWVSPKGRLRSLCSNFETRLSRGQWNTLNSDTENQRKILNSLQSYKASFQNAIRSRNFMVARAELQSIEDTLRQISTEQECHIDAEKEKLEVKFSELRIQDSLGKNQTLEAAEEWGRLTTKIQGRSQSLKMDRIVKRLRRKAADLYIEGYQLEDTQPEKSESLIEEAEKICSALQLGAECYRAKHIAEISSSAQDP